MTISRRTALAGAAAVVAVSPALANTALARLSGGDAKLLDLEREYFATLKAWGEKSKSQGGMDDPEFDVWGDKCSAIDDEIFSTPSDTLTGLQVKLRRLSYWCGPDDETGCNQPEMWKAFMREFANFVARAS